MRLLIIEDEQDLAIPLQKGLEREGFAVDYAEDGEIGLREAMVNPYDCILLDLNLPKLDGIALSNKLRESNNSTPIIMLTARSQQYDKLEGFQHGADDYITKPFDFLELVARINSVIRRSSSNQNHSLTFLDMEFNPKLNIVTLPNKIIIELSNKESGILEYLIRNQGRYVSAEEIMEHVWDREADLFSDTVKTHIKTLRKKIDPSKKLIKTMRGKGYLLSA